MLRSGSKRWLAGGLLALTACLAAGPTRAQAVSEEAVKAGFVFNFVKFTQWTGEREGENRPLEVCTPGALPLDGHFAVLHGRMIGSRKIVLRAHVAPGEWRSCHVVYLPEAEAGRFESALRSLGSASVLTISDQPGFAQAGGMIGLRIEDQRVRFDVNLQAAQRAGLTLSSQMLKLAGQVLR
jgi:YfiR/HmsC-like